MLWIVISCIITFLTLFGTIELLILTVGGLLPSRRLSSVRPPPQQIAVVIPAHNEEAGIAHCLNQLFTCAQPNRPFLVYVVADNCTDNTAGVAQTAGATVLIREDTSKRGKGYALDYAFQHLLSIGVDAVLVVDADTYVEPAFVIACEQVFRAGAEAIQCRYTVNNPEASLRTRLLHLALLAFNVLRPRGRERWGLSVGISGNGFGLTRQALQKVPYQARSVVEDLEYHLLLVKAGLRVWFVDTTTVRADMPTGKRGVESQRARWEGGRLRMLYEFVPALARNIMAGQWSVLEPLLELLLLPLALHVLLLLVLLVIPFPPTQIYAACALLLVILHVLGGWWVGGGSWKELNALAIAPFYILWKLTQLPLLLRTAKKEATWVRTERKTEEKKP